MTSYPGNVCLRAPLQNMCHCGIRVPAKRALSIYFRIGASGPGWTREDIMSQFEYIDLIVCVNQTITSYPTV